MRAFRICSVSLAVFLVTVLSATANTCNSFASFTCSQSTPNVVHLLGTGATGQSVGIVLGSSFSVTFMGNKSFLGDDLIILAAAPNGLTEIGRASCRERVYSEEVSVLANEKTDRSR